MKVLTEEFTEAMSRVFVNSSPIDQLILYGYWAGGLSYRGLAERLPYRITNAQQAQTQRKIVSTLYELVPEDVEINNNRIQRNAGNIVFKAAVIITGVKGPEDSYKKYSHQQVKITLDRLHGRIKQVYKGISDRPGKSFFGIRPLRGPKAWSPRGNTEQE